MLSSNQGVFVQGQTSSLSYSERLACRDFHCQNPSGFFTISDPALPYTTISTVYPGVIWKWQPVEPLPPGTSYYASVAMLKIDSIWGTQELNSLSDAPPPQLITPLSPTFTFQVPTTATIPTAQNGVQIGFAMVLNAVDGDGLEDLSIPLSSHENYIPMMIPISDSAPTFALQGLPGGCDRTACDSASSQCQANSDENIYTCECKPGFARYLATDLHCKLHLTVSPNEVAPPHFRGDKIPILPFWDEEDNDGLRNADFIAKFNLIDPSSPLDTTKLKIDYIRLSLYKDQDPMEVQRMATNAMAATFPYEVPMTRNKFFDFKRYMYGQPLQVEIQYWNSLDQESIMTVKFDVVLETEENWRRYVASPPTTTCDWRGSKYIPSTTTCQCRPGYYGEDCSILISVKSATTGIAFSNNNGVFSTSSSVNSFYTNDVVLLEITANPNVLDQIIAQGVVPTATSTIHADYLSFGKIKVESSNSTYAMLIFQQWATTTLTIGNISSPIQIVIPEVPFIPTACVISLQCNLAGTRSCSATICNCLAGFVGAKCDVPLPTLPSIIDSNQPLVITSTSNLRYLLVYHPASQTAPSFITPTFTGTTLKTYSFSLDQAQIPNMTAMDATLFYTIVFGDSLYSNTLIKVTIPTLATSLPSAVPVDKRCSTVGTRKVYTANYASWPTASDQLCLCHTNKKYFGKYCQSILSLPSNTIFINTKRDSPVNRRPIGFEIETEAGYQQGKLLAMSTSNEFIVTFNPFFNDWYAVETSSGAISSYEQFSFWMNISYENGSVIGATMSLGSSQGTQYLLSGAYLSKYAGLFQNEFFYNPLLKPNGLPLCDQSASAIRITGNKVECLSGYTTSIIGTGDRGSQRVVLWDHYRSDSNPVPSKSYTQARSSSSEFRTSSLFDASKFFWVSSPRNEFVGGSTQTVNVAYNDINDKRNFYLEYPEFAFPSRQTSLLPTDMYLNQQFYSNINVMNSNDKLMQKYFSTDPKTKPDRLPCNPFYRTGYHGTTKQPICLDEKCLPYYFGINCQFRYVFKTYGQVINESTQELEFYTAPVMVGGGITFSIAFGPYHNIIDATLSCPSLSSSLTAQLSPNPDQPGHYIFTFDGSGITYPLGEMACKLTIQPQFMNNDDLYLPKIYIPIRLYSDPCQALYNLRLANPKALYGDNIDQDNRGIADLCQEFKFTILSNWLPSTAATPLYIPNTPIKMSFTNIRTTPVNLIGVTHLSVSGNNAPSAWSKFDEKIVILPGQTFDFTRILDIPQLSSGYDLMANIGVQYQDGIGDWKEMWVPSSILQIASNDDESCPTGFQWPSDSSTISTGCICEQPYDANSLFIGPDCDVKFQAQLQFAEPAVQVTDMIFSQGKFRLNLSLSSQTNPTPVTRFVAIDPFKLYFGGQVFNPSESYASDVISQSPSAHFPLTFDLSSQAPLISTANQMILQVSTNPGSTRVDYLPVILPSQFVSSNQLAVLALKSSPQPCVLSLALSYNANTDTCTCRSYDFVSPSGTLGVQYHSFVFGSYCQTEVRIYAGSYLYPGQSIKYVVINHSTNAAWTFSSIDVVQFINLNDLSNPIVTSISATTTGILVAPPSSPTIPITKMYEPLSTFGQIKYGFRVVSSSVILTSSSITPAYMLNPCFYMDVMNYATVCAYTTTSPSPTLQCTPDPITPAVQCQCNAGYSGTECRVKVEMTSNSVPSSSTNYPSDALLTFKFTPVPRSRSFTNHDLPRTGYNNNLLSDYKIYTSSDNDDGIKFVTGFNYVEFIEERKTKFISIPSLHLTPPATSKIQKFFYVNQIHQANSTQPLLFSTTSSMSILVSQITITQGGCSPGCGDRSTCNPVLNQCECPSWMIYNPTLSNCVAINVSPVTCPSITNDFTSSLPNFFTPGSAFMLKTPTSLVSPSTDRSIKISPSSTLYSFNSPYHLYSSSDQYTPTTITSALQLKTVTNTCDANRALGYVLPTSLNPYQYYNLNLITGSKSQSLIQDIVLQDSCIVIAGCNPSTTRGCVTTDDMSLCYCKQGFVGQQCQFELQSPDLHFLPNDDTYYIATSTIANGIDLRFTTNLVTGGIMQGEGDSMVAYLEYYSPDEPSNYGEVSFSNQLYGSFSHRQYILYPNDMLDIPEGVEMFIYIGYDNGYRGRYGGSMVKVKVYSTCERLNIRKNPCYTPNMNADNDDNCVIYPIEGSNDPRQCKCKEPINNEYYFGSRCELSGHLPGHVPFEAFIPAEGSTNILTSQTPITIKAQPSFIRYYAYHSNKLEHPLQKDTSFLYVGYRCFSGGVIGETRWVEDSGKILFDFDLHNETVDFPTLSPDGLNEIVSETCYLSSNHPNNMQKLMVVSYLDVKGDKSDPQELFLETDLKSALTDDYIQAALPEVLVSPVPPRGITWAQYSQSWRTIEVKWNPPEEFISGLYYRFYLFTSTEDDSIFQTNLFVNPVPFITTLSSSFELIQRKDGISLTPTSLKTTFGPKSFDYTTTPNHPDLSYRDLWVPQTPFQQKAEFLIPSEVIIASGTYLHVVMVPSIIDRDLFYTKNIGSLTATLDVKCYATCDESHATNPTKCNPFTGRCECTKAGTTWSEYTQNCQLDSPTAITSTSQLSPISQYQLDEMNPCPIGLLWNSLGNLCEPRTHAIANTTRVGMIYLRNRDSTKTLENKYGDTSVGGNGMKAAFFANLTQEVSSGLGLWTPYHQHIKEHTWSEFDHSMDITPPDGGMFERWFTGEYGQAEYNPGLLCPEILTISPLSQGRGGILTYDTATITISFNCWMLLYLGSNNDHELSQQILFLQRRVKFFETKLNQFFPSSPTTVVPTWSLSPLTAQLVSGQSISYPIKLFRPGSPLHNTVMTSRYNVDNVALTTYCQSFDGTNTIAQCPSVRVHETSKFWSPCTTVTGTTGQVKTLKPVCLDYNMKPYLADSSNPWCVSSIWNRNFPLRKQIAVCDTATQPPAPTLTLFDGPSPTEYQYGTILNGNIIKLTWVYQGSQANTVAIYLEGVQIASAPPDYAPFIMNSEVKRNEDNLTSFSTSSSGAFTTQATPVVNQDGRYYLTSTAAVNQMAYITLPYSLVTATWNSPTARFFAVLVQDIRASLPSQHYYSIYNPPSLQACISGVHDLSLIEAPCIPSDNTIILNYNVFDLHYATPQCPSNCRDHSSSDSIGPKHTCNRANPKAPKCICASGWEGPACDIPTKCQVGDNICNKHGFITATWNNNGLVTCQPNSCSCNVFGWSGSTTGCNTCNIISSLNCIDKGTNATATNQSCNRCICNRGYAGETCQFRSFYTSLVFRSLTSLNTQALSFENDDFDILSLSFDHDDGDLDNNDHEWSVEMNIYDDNDDDDNNNNNNEKKFISSISFTPSSSFITQSLLDLPAGDGLDKIPAEILRDLLTDIAVALGLSVKDVEVLRVFTTIVNQIPKPSKNTSPKANISSQPSIYLETLQSSGGMKNTTTTVTFSITSSVPSSTTTTTPSSTTHSSEPSSLDDLYNQWNKLQTGYQNSPIGNTTAIRAFGEPETPLAAYDPLCQEDNGNNGDTCPTGSDPFVENTNDPSSVTPRASTTTIIIIVVVVVGCILLVGIFAWSLWYCFHQKKGCFKEPERSHNRKNNSNNNTTNGTEMSTATNLNSNSNDNNNNSIKTTTSVSSKPTYSGGMSTDQSSQKTVDLSPAELDDNEDELPINWGKWKHNATGEILYINSATMMSQRHAPGTDDIKSGKWF